MAVTRALRRLLRIRDLQEEQCRLALESSQGELNRLEDALKGTTDRDRRGRRLLEASARNGELPDRLSGLEEMRTAIRIAAVLAPRIEAKQMDVNTRRQAIQATRVARKQAESLIADAETADAVDAGRRGQQALDDWFSSRVHQARSQQKRKEESAKGASVEAGSNAEVRT
jgi:cell division FtsZ-interacting protein ZapD